MSELEYEIIDTRITDKWGVEWNEMEIVRDFLQNFYDENPTDQIEIEIENRKITVSAPREFDYKSLIYLGSDKGSEEIGQYGEGFKAALLNAMRQHGCTVKAQINSVLLEFFFESKKIGETEKKVIMCKRSKTTPINGTKLVLENSSKELIEQFKFGLNFFYYEKNPLFGERLTTYPRDIIIYKSPRENKGYIFYKKLLRAELDVPLVVVCNRTYKSIDDKIKHDRDRKAFDEAVLDKLLSYLFKNIDVSVIINILKEWWQSGHRVLRFASHSRRKYHFPDNYYAKSSKRYISGNLSLLMEIDQMEKEWDDKGFIKCPGYMANLGMKDALSIIQKNKADQKKKHLTIYTRKPTNLEGEALNFLKTYIRRIDPLLANQFSTANYTIGDSDELVGELRNGRKWRSNDVYLSKYFFLLDFSKALAILLHEWGHIHGFDGSRRFTDALTEFIAAIIEERDGLDEIEEKWNEISLEIRNELEENGLNSIMHNLVDQLTNKQKTQLLKSLPEEELLKLIEKEGVDTSTKR